MPPKIIFGLSQAAHRRSFRQLYTSRLVTGHYRNGALWALRTELTKYPSALQLNCFCPLLDCLVLLCPFEIVYYSHESADSPYFKAMTEDRRILFSLGFFTISLVQEDENHDYHYFTDNS